MSDLVLYDTGRLIVASDKCDATGEGYFEVDYRIRFFNYHLEEGSPIQNRVLVARLITSSQEVFTETEALVAFNSLTEDFGGDDTVVNDGGSIRLPKGKYLVLATVGVQDDTAESYSLQTRIKKNAAALSPDAITFNEWASSGSVHPHSTTIQGIVDSDGTDEVGLYVTVEGNAGDFVIVKDTTTMTIVALS
jgi:hypothetical protein